MQQSISMFTMDSTKYLKKRFNLPTSNVGGQATKSCLSH